ncbi:hypothetical protein WA026_003065 [Henosepilachna vigintioctopunctata]|uniref:Major facilitator superfamily (MFS) profile domain-containing protein n=1 Tax=Henosepilachna vigintioctopunctata TaxID=420089 RepID=A0AAW1TNJ2_9CUCU
MFWKLFKSNDGTGLNEYIASILACILGFSVGIHTGWTSPFIRKLTPSEGYPFEVSSEDASYIAICGPCGDLIGDVTSMLVVDKIGRKNTLIYLGIPLLISNLLIYFSYLFPWLIYVARISGGISMGTFMTIAPIYISEISRPAIRGKLGIFVVFSGSAGMIAVNLAGKYFNIFSSALIFAAIVLSFLILFCFMPETPYYYLMKGNIMGAEKSLRFLRKRKDVKKELDCLVEDVKRQLSEKGNTLDLLRVVSNRKALYMMVSARIFQQFTGFLAFTMYARSILTDSEEIIDPESAVVIVSFILTFIGILSGNLSDKFGRIPLIVSSTAVCTITLTLFGVYFTLRDFSDVDVPIWSPLVLFTVHYIMLQLGIGSLLSVMLGELFSASIKPKAVCAVNIIFSLSVIVTAKFYQICTDYLHTSVCFYVFAVSTLIATFIIKYYFPETKGKTLEEIQMDLRGETRRRSKISISIF